MSFELFSSLALRRKLRDKSLDIRGNAALYVLVVLPVSIVFLFVTIDLVRWQSLKQQLQAETDRISLLAAEALPNVSLANEIIESAVANSSLVETGFSPVSAVNSNSVSLSLGGKVNSSLANFLPNLEVFSAWQHAKVELMPIDVSLILADSLSLRPSQYQSWGDEISWPAADYFNRVGLPCNSGQFPKLGEVCSNGVETEFSRWATQTCFNPSISALKEAAISIANLVSTSSSNRLAISFTPGDNPNIGFSTSRNLAFPDLKKANSWSNFLDHELQLGDETCLYFSNPKTSLNSRYRFSSALDSAEVFSSPSPLASGVHFTGNKLNRSYVDANLDPTDIIYYRMARPHSNSANGENIAAALENAACQLHPECGLETISEVSSELSNRRGNKSLSSERFIILVSDFLPEPNDTAFNKSLKLLNTAGVKTIFIAFSHPGLSTVEASTLERRSKDLFEREEVLVWLANSPNKLNKLVKSNIANVIQDYSLSS